MNNREKGEAGERLALKYLKDKGYNILDVNYTCKLGEIDIIAETWGILVFIEVKLRTGLAHGYPREAVGFKKQKKIRLCAQSYIAFKKLYSMDCRFDVIEIIIKGKTEITHIENAF